MKTAITLLVVMLAGLVTCPVQAQDNWFDMEGCAICKVMGDHPELMMEVKWDVYTVDNGMVMVSVVPEKHKAVMKEAHEHMKKTAARMKQGETMELCGFCKSYGALEEAGAMIQELETIGGQLTIVTSDDADLVAKIHAHAKHSKAAAEAMKKAMAADQ